jgi:hypothetical protein
MKAEHLNEHFDTVHRLVVADDGKTPQNTRNIYNMTCLRSFVHNPAPSRAVLYFEVSLGVTAYVGRTNLSPSLVACTCAFPF